MKIVDRGRLIRTLHSYMNQLSDEELLEMYSKEMKDCKLCQYHCPLYSREAGHCNIISILGDKE